MGQGGRSIDGIGEAREKYHLDKFLANMHVIGFQHDCIACVYCCMYVRMWPTPEISLIMYMHTNLHAGARDYVCDQVSGAPNVI